MGRKQTDRIVYYTSAPEGYDGFGTETLAVVGREPRTGNDVRKVSTPAEHHEWQTQRYGSGLHRYTSPSLTLEYHAKFGDWEIDTEAMQATKADRTPAYVKALRAERDEAIAERDALQARVDELAAYLLGDKFRGEGNDWVNVRDVLTRIGR